MPPHVSSGTRSPTDTLPQWTATQWPWQLPHNYPSTPITLKTTLCNTCKRNLAFRKLFLAERVERQRDGQAHARASRWVARQQEKWGRALLCCFAPTPALCTASCRYKSTDTEKLLLLFPCGCGVRVTQALGISLFTEFSGTQWWNGGGRGGGRESGGSGCLHTLHFDTVEWILQPFKCRWRNARFPEK